MEGGGESTPRRKDHLKSVSDGEESGQGRQSEGAEAASEGESDSGGFYNPDELRDSENDGGLYNPNGDRRGIFRRGGGSTSSERGKKLGLINRHKLLFGVVSVITAGAISLSAFFFASLFDLPNFMKNIEQAGFQRYQVDLNGRSSEWLRTYMELRFGEIEDPNLAPKDRDNIFFHADKVSNNKPLTDWYRTLRGSNFEQEVFESKGIRFTSIAERKGSIIRYRPAIISFDTGRPITFDPGQKTFDALAHGDPNAFNGALQDFVNKEQVFNSDKEARAAIKQVAREHYPNWWKAIKRYHVRQDVQNMIGVRKWSFFEKTRNNLHEKKISMRNKILIQALPEDSKTGAFIKCLFGVPDCNSSTDAASPDNTEPQTTGANKKSQDKTTGTADNPQPVGDGSGDSALADAAGTGVAGDAGKIAGKIISKISSRAGLFSLLDSLSRFDEAIHNNTFSKIVAQAKSQRVAGMFAVFGVAADQLTTGQQSSGEVNDFMQQFKHPTNTEGWATVVDPNNGTNRASADSTKYVQAKNKAQFCSDQHQSEMAAHPKEAEKEFQWLCPKNQVGGSSNAQQLEDTWNNGLGQAIHPILDAYHKATGGIFDIFNSITSAITTPIINGVLTLTGTKDDVNHVVAAAGAKALELGGATSDINENSPSGQLANDVLQGSAVVAETSMRDQGGASTTAETAALANKNVLAYEIDQQHTSFYNRWVSPSNPKSLFSRQFFALTTSGYDNLGQDFADIFGTALSSPWKALSWPAHAMVPDGYGAAKFAGIDTYDMPKECINSSPLNMTPQSATNADDLGYFKPEELNWDLMTNKKNWYDTLYQKAGDDEDKAKKVWNCALFDDTVRSGIGAQYGYKGVNAISTGNDSGSSSSASGAAGGFTNPFPGGWIPNRLDMGYDGTFKGKIVAPFDGVVTYAGPFTGWNGSSGVIIKADHDVGLPTRSLFFTEGVAPITSLQGKHVTAGTPIANAAPSPYGDAYGVGSSNGSIEWGVAEDGNVGQFVDTEAVALGNCSNAARSMVLAFSQWAQDKLGVAPPASTDHAGCA